MKLKVVIEQAKDEGKNFLSINDSWNLEERDLFRRGVIMYRGPARIEYCKTTGLTSDMADSSTMDELVDIAINVGILDDEDEVDEKYPSLAALRNRLKMFILYG